MFIGLSVGTTCGYLIGTWVARPYYPSPVMKAVACLAFRDPDVCIIFEFFYGIWSFLLEFETFQKISWNLTFKFACAVKCINVVLQFDSLTVFYNS